MITRPSNFKLAAAAGALTIGLCSAWIKQNGADFDISEWQQAAQNLVVSEQRFTPPAAPFLGDGDSQDDDEAALALRNGDAPHPEQTPSVNLADASKQLGLDMTGLSEAIGFYKTGALAQGDVAAKSAKDKTVQIALEWVALRTFPREAGFERIQAFLAAHPSWPAQDWLRRRSEEALFGDHKSANLIKTYFTASEPQTPAGRLALAHVLRDDGKTAEAAALVREVWRDADLNGALEARIRSDFGALLQKADYKYRADRLLYKEDMAGAMRSATLAGPDVAALAKARAAVSAEAPSDKLLASVPTPLRADPGFQFAMIQKLRRADKIREAANAMLAAPRDPVVLVNGDEWWVERRLLARKLLDQNDAKAAYKLCAEHSAMTREMQIEAEFHAGWIALRFLNDPIRAAGHFEAVAKLALTPMSAARAAYWRGRAAEASATEGAAVAAKTFYEQAAAHPATYYGQLALAKLGVNAPQIRTPAAEATGDARDDSIKVVELLYAIGEKGLASPLVVEAVRHLEDPAQVSALASIVAKQQDAHLSLTIGKLAGQRGIALDALAFPTYGVPAFEPLQNSADTSVSPKSIPTPSWFPLRRAANHLPSSDVLLPYTQPDKPGRPPVEEPAPA